MAKKEKDQATVERAVELDQGTGPISVYPDGVSFETARDMLFDLYVARVAKAETINTMRRDGHAIFRDALAEAKVALDVYLKDKQENEGHE